MRLEQELRRALRRESPSADFAARVVEKATSRTGSVSRSTPRWAGLAAAASLVVTIGWGYHAYVKRQAEERTVDQVCAALQIAGEKLSEVQRKLQGVDNHDAH